MISDLLQTKNNRKNLLKHIAFICLLLLMVREVSAESITSYYISLSGNDENSGSLAKPFRTIRKLNSISLKPNTTIYLQAGTVFSGPLILEADEGGTENEPVVITSYGKGAATIDGNFGEAIIVKSNHFILRNINARGAGRKRGSTSNGIYITASASALIENIVTEGFQKSGIEINNSSDIRLNKVIAVNNGFCGIYVSGIRSSSKNITISNCRADNNAGDPANFTNHSGNGILVGGSDSVLVDHCTATNNGWDMPRTGNGPVGIWGYECDHLTIQYCISYRNKTHTGASDGGGFDLDGGVTNSIIQYCLSYENEGSGYGLYQYKGAGIWSNNTVRYCVSINDGQLTKGAAGFLIWNESADSSQFGNCLVYNNTVYNNASPVIRFDDNSVNKNFLFANNIFLGINDIVSGPSSGDIYFGNAWWHIAGKRITFRKYKSLEEWANQTGQKKLNGKIIGLAINPFLNGPFITDITDPYKLSLLDGFKLQPGSPLKNKGVDLAALYGIAVPSKDFFGNATGKKIRVPGIHQLAK